MQAAIRSALFLLPCAVLAASAQSAPPPHPTSIPTEVPHMTREQAEDYDYKAPPPTPGVKPCPNLHATRRLSEFGHPSVEQQSKLDIDVDGAPNAYGPKGTHPLDILKHSHSPTDPKAVVGYMTEYDGGPPTVQRKGDPYPGYYVSQTDFADLSNKRKEDPRRYVDATRIAYVVQGKVAREAGVVMGDFATVYSCRTGRTVFALVADSGNESGAEGSLALARELGYDIRNGVEDSVDDPEIVIHYFPRSNPQHYFPKTQEDLDQAAEAFGLKR